MIWRDIRTAHAQRFLDDKSRNNGRRDLYKVSYERKLNFLSIYDSFEFIHFICFNTLIQRSDFYDGTVGAAPIVNTLKIFLLSKIFLYFFF